MAFEVNLHSLIHCWLPIDHMFATLTSSSVAAHFDTVLWLSSRQAAWRSYDNRVRTRYVHVTIPDKLVWTSSTFLIWISGGSFQALNSDQ